MFQPGLANLLEPLVVADSTAHAIEVLRNDGMIAIRQCKPMQWLLPVITGSGSDPQADKAYTTSTLLHRRQISNDDIRLRDSINRRLGSLSFPAGRTLRRRHRHRSQGAIDNDCDLD